MSDSKTCTACKGRKRIMGIGMMEADCKTCAGTGKIIEDKDKELREDMRTLADAYQTLQDENQKLKAEIEKLKKSTSKPITKKSKK